MFVQTHKCMCNVINRNIFLNEKKKLSSFKVIKLNKLFLKFFPVFYLNQINNVNKYNNFFFIAPPSKIRFSVPVERVETTIFNPRIESRYFNLLHSYSQSDSQESCYEIVHYVPRRRMRVIAGRATMLAGDRS